MSQKIITLPKHLASQIAAGEVVERPVSVVKELVENSLDAGALQVDIKLENGGINLIEVKDDGRGIPADSLEKALEKYSTSKIQSLEDLQEVLTFGFRGQALASISSVSNFSLISNTGKSSAGRIIVTKDGENFETGEQAHERGTTIQVKNIFHNTPARLNYLKKPRTEYLKILEFIQKISLIYPEVGFTLQNEGKTSLHFPRNQRIEQRIYDVYGNEFSENILSFRHEFGGVEVRGHISDPKVSFSNKNRQLMFVNNRIIQSPMITKAIIDAYNRFIPHGSFPAYILDLRLDPTQVDVNVHPRKMEVRFAQESNIFRSVYHGIKNKLETVSLVDTQEYQSPSMISPSQTSSGIEKSGDTELKIQYYTGSGTKFKNYSPYKNTDINPAQASIEFSKSLLTHNTQSSEDFTKDMYETPLGRIIGQVHNSYILVQTQEGIKILDQHALAERVIYERLAHTSYIPKIQQILGGVGIHLTVQEREILESFYDAFTSMGFEIEVLSQGNILIQAIPDFVQKENIEKIFKKILGDISELGSNGLDDIRHRLWAYTACRSAVKFGDPLSIFEMHTLLCDASIEYSATCPHGRPVVYEINLEELQKKYER